MVWSLVVVCSFRRLLVLLGVVRVRARIPIRVCIEGSEQMRSIFRTVGLLAAIAVAVLAMQVSALAAPPDVVGPDNGVFLCPAVGHGVTIADAHNGDNGVSTIGPIASGDQSFLPGHNQAGAKSNPTAHNTQGPGTSPGPGNGNADWSPIWPAPTS